MKNANKAKKPTIEKKPEAPKKKPEMKKENPIRPETPKEPPTIKKTNDYLASALSSPVIQANVRKSAAITASYVESNIQNLVLSQPIIPTGSPLALHSLKFNNSSETSLSSKAQFERKLEQMRIEQSKREREELKERLRMVDENINLMNYNKMHNPKLKSHSWLSEEDRKKWKEDLEAKEKNAKEFSKKMREVQVQLKMEKKKAEMKEKMELDREKKKSLEETKKMEEAKRKEMEEKKEQAELKKKDMRKFMDYATSVVPKTECLHSKMEKQFSTKNEETELEKKKRCQQKKGI